jgi:hypothetical protein
VAKSSHENSPPRSFGCGQKATEAPLQGRVEESVSQMTDSDIQEEKERGNRRMSTDGTCLLCESGAEAITGVNGSKIICARCGAYRVANDLSPELLGDKRSYLSAATRQFFERSGREKSLLLTSENWRAYAEPHERTRVMDRLNNMLVFMASQARGPGKAVKLDGSDYPLFDMRDQAEMEALLWHAEKEGLLEIASSGGWRVSVKGFQLVEPTIRPGGTPGTCFIAMSFNSDLSESLELGFIPAIEVDCRFKAVRIDRKEHNNQITDEIMAGIRGAEFMVADFTGHRGGVYYEAGFARGLGREVIYCCREDAFAERHFDTSVINHVVWKEPADLRKKLADRIRATILPVA